MDLTESQNIKCISSLFFATFICSSSALILNISITHRQNISNPADNALINANTMVTGTSSIFTNHIKSFYFHLFIFIYFVSIQLVARTINHPIDASTISVSNILVTSTIIFTN